MTEDFRARAQVELSLELRLRQIDGGADAWAQMENLTPAGFFCRSDTPFCPGDPLDCELFISGTNFQNRLLQLRAKVARVELRGMRPGFFIACVFEQRISTIASSVCTEAFLNLR